MRFKIGKLKNGTDVFVSELSPNTHMIMSGMSGSGKSVRIRQIIKNNHSPNQTILIFDLDGKTFEDNGENINHINASDDGIALHLLDSSILNTDRDVYVNYISYITDILTNTADFGVRQQGALRMAIEYALKNLDKYPSEMDAIVAGLELQSSNVAQGVYNKLWTVLSCGIFRPSQKKIVNGAINVISFEGIAPGTQKILVEIMLGMLWKSLRFEKCKTGSLTIVIDEFQNISLKKNSVIMEMLRESRKYGVSIILATQSITPLSKETLSYVHQAAIQLYFKPSTMDMKKVANIIAPNDPDRWTLVLRNMRIGESVAVGNICINGQELFKPLVIQSDWETQHSLTSERRS